MSNRPLDDFTDEEITVAATVAKCIFGPDPWADNITFTGGTKYTGAHVDSVIANGLNVLHRAGLIGLTVTTPPEKLEGLQEGWRCFRITRRAR